MKIRIYKEDYKIEFDFPKGGKLSILALDSKYCVIKENGYSGYVHRGIGSVYQCPQIYIFEIKDIRNYEKFIEVYLEKIWAQEVIKNHLDSFIDLICDHFPQLEYDPLANYPSAQRKQIEEHLQRQKELEADLIRRIDA